MGKILILLSFFVCVASCSTKRVITTSSEENATHAKEMGKIDIVRTVTDNTKTDTDINDRITTIRTINFKVYDTEKSDSAGHHPLLAEGEIREHNTKESSLTTNEETRGVEATTYNGVGESDITIENKNNDATFTRSERPNFSTFIIFLAVIALASLAVKIYRRL